MKLFSLEWNKNDICNLDLISLKKCLKKNEKLKWIKKRNEMNNK